MIRPLTFWADKQIELKLGTGVTEVDPAAQVVTLADGTRWSYGTLIWAAGSDPGASPARAPIWPASIMCGTRPMPTG